MKQLVIFLLAGSLLLGMSCSSSKTLADGTNVEEMVDDYDSRAEKLQYEEYKLRSARYQSEGGDVLAKGYYNMDGELVWLSRQLQYSASKINEVYTFSPRGSLERVYIKEMNYNCDDGKKDCISEVKQYFKDGKPVYQLERDVEIKKGSDRDAAKELMDEDWDDEDISESAYNVALRNVKSAKNYLINQ